MYDARFYVFQEGEETGFAPDETDSFLSHFILMQPTEFNLDDDGIYEMIFSGRGRLRRERRWPNGLLTRWLELYTPEVGL